MWSENEYERNEENKQQLKNGFFFKVRRSGITFE